MNIQSLFQMTTNKTIECVKGSLTYQEIGESARKEKPNQREAVCMDSVVVEKSERWAHLEP
jgi:hypothetical protein